VKVSDDWPDRVYVENSQYEKIHELFSKTSGASRQTPFKSLKEVLLAAAMLGYNLGLKPELESRKEIIYTKYLDSQLDIPVVLCLAIADQQNVGIIGDKKTVVEIFQRYVKGGFEPLHETIRAGSDEIQSYAAHLLGNYVN